jgi:Rrf2 family nitric oxide-sensitive transcriptional repressor
VVPLSQEDWIVQLTRFTDYSPLVLIYSGLDPERVVSISEISEAFGISRNHLMKVVHNLAKLAYIESLQGRGSGVRLSRACDDQRNRRSARSETVGMGRRP